MRNPQSTNKLEVPWDFCIPYYYGEYEGILKDGSPCRIDVDWKIRAFNAQKEQVGTDQIRSWFATPQTIKSLTDELEHKSNIGP